MTEPGIQTGSGQNVPASAGSGSATKQNKNFDPKPFVFSIWGKSCDNLESLQLVGTLLRS